ncbi:MAG: helix-turn-helix domain-containing protein [Rhodospirillaceae bacterium]|nr:helix-turn-helix domain-containing protein [Rhodospirillaceae bacterium]MYB11929.1 helix-turn-helix domain-containing protein [Rhodospirillaceae bacterium]MYI48638.1 helix-turn-helix domain-containing protein [Rhodospirillaceae bacterium]
MTVGTEKNGRGGAPVTNRSTRHLFAAVRAIAQHRKPVGLADLVAELDLPASTVHRALMTLEACGMVKRGDRGARFVAGDMVHHLIRALVAQFPVRRAAAGFLRDLSGSRNVTVSLNHRLGWRSLRLLSFEGTQEAYQLRRVGEARPLHDGIGPATILAALPDDEAAAYLDRCRRSGNFGGAPIDPRRMARQRRELAGAGYISQRPSDYSLLHWAAVPLTAFGGAAIASVSIGFDVERGMEGKLESEIAYCVARIAALQEQLDRDPEATRTPFGTLAPDEFHLPHHRVVRFDNPVASTPAHT